MKHLSIFGLETVLYTSHVINQTEKQINLTADTINMNTKSWCN